MSEVRILSPRLVASPLLGGQNVAKVLDSLIDVIISIDERGTIRAATRPLQRVFGYRPTEILGKNVSVLMPEPHHSQHDQYLKRYLESGKPQIIGKGRELVARRKDGSLFPISLAVSEVAAEEGRCFVGIIRDISGRRAAEDRIRLLEAQHRELERAAVAGEMAAIVAHEIRTPLNALAIHAQIVERLLREPTEESLKRSQTLLHTVKGEIGRINSLLEEYSATLKPSPLRLQPCSINALIEEAVQFLHPQAQRSGTRIDLSLERSCAKYLLRGDPPRLRQCLLNLLVNAMEAGAKRIAVATEQRGDALYVRISNNGPAIPQATLQHLFKPFFTTKQAGTGLGLAICERIIRQHGGRITASSDADVGVTFEIELPCDPKSAEHCQNDPLVSPPTRQTESF